MKYSKTIFYLGVIFLFGCGENEGYIINIPPPSSGDIMAIKASCMGCHSKVENFHGPSIEKISLKYRNSDINVLVSTVKRGRKKSELIWGDTPKPSSTYSKEEIKIVIEWMLN